jgi:hypothetical protein
MRTTIKFSNRGGAFVEENGKYQPKCPNDWVAFYLRHIEKQGVKIDGARIVMPCGGIMADVEILESGTLTYQFFI